MRDGFRLEDAKRIWPREIIYEAGRAGEDNSIVESFLYYVVAETPMGARFRHDFIFNSTKHHDDCEFGCWTRDREGDSDRCEAFANRIQAHLDAGGSLDPTHWTSIQGSYCSEAWDESLELELEREEDAREEQRFGHWSC